MANGQGGFVGLLIGIVIALGLTSTVATSTSSASTALAPFAGAQSLVIIVPLIWVALILYAAYQITQRPGGVSFQYNSAPRLSGLRLRVLEGVYRSISTSRV